MMNRNILIAMLLLCIGCSCNKDSGQQAADDGDVTDTPLFEYDVAYTEDEANFCNPERGLYTPTISYFRNGKMPQEITAAGLRNLRKSGKTLSFAEFYLHDFVYSDLSDEALAFIRDCFQKHREAGVKAIVRFAYSDGYDESDHPWDAPCDQTLRHVAQLKPIFNEFEDVIYVVQYGFVGSWGEGYYTDYYGMNPTTDEDYRSRRTLMKALLDAVPVSRQVAVRYPLYKRGILGISIADTITAKTAFGTSDIARVAAFNDCFVSSANDVGTYNASGDREMWAVETNYVSMGGETCAVKTSYCNCGNTYDNLVKYHWTYLNDAYHRGVMNQWTTEGCFDDIKKRLGYRFVLKGAAFDGDFTASGKFTLKLHIDNVGFASLINERPMEWVIVNADNSSERYVISSPKDPREWKGSHEWIYEETFTLPSGLKKGASYKLCLNLPDASSKLRDNPDFSVRLANEGVWDEAEGWNVLCTMKAE
ncbi:MAG: DUF4832 domain-containing protein [Bacteroidales bacterium]|nr:DUF4832 domain-containing protein [Bacteroidales bacterium]